MSAIDIGEPGIDVLELARIARDAATLGRVGEAWAILAQISHLTRDRGRPNVGHAVVDGVVRYLSVSAIEKANHTSEGCLRRWFYRYVEHRAEPSTAAQQVGVGMHAELKVYLRTGERRFGALAATGMHMVPEPGPDLLVEHPIAPMGDDAEAALREAPLTADGIPLIGDIDLGHMRGTNRGTESIEETRDPDGTIELLDWKSTGDGRYAKTGPGLIQTVQMSGYGEWAARVTGHTGMIRLSHGYFFTKKRAPGRKVTALVHRDEIREAWGKADGIARSIRAAAKETIADRVPANLAACRAFGGCPHRAYCTAGMTSSLDTFLGRTGAEAALNPDQGSAPVTDIMSFLQGGKPAPAPVATPVAPTPPPVVVDPKEAARLAAIAATPGLVDALATIKAANLGRPMLRGEATNALIDVTGLGATRGAALAGAGDLAKFIFDQPGQLVELAAILADPVKKAGLVQALAGVAPEPAPAPTTTMSVGVIAPIPAALIRMAPPDAPASHPTLAQSQPETAAPTVPAGSIAAVTEERPKAPRKPPTKRTDPAGSNGEPATTTVNNTTIVQAPGADPAPTPTGLMIFVDCPVVSCQTTDMGPMIDKWCRLLEERCPNADGSPLDDVRFAYGDNKLAFGRWRGALAALVRESKIPPGAYTLTTRGDERAELVAATLRAKADLLVWGGAR